MIHPQEIQMLVRLIFSALAGIIIGIDREISDKPAGTRTLMLISTGSALLTLISIHLRDIYPSPNADPARLMAQIVTGIGFVGGGVILKSNERVLGVTTAAIIWITAAVGIAFGAGFYLVGVFAILLVLLLKPLAMLQFYLGLKSFSYDLVFSKRHFSRVKKLLDGMKVKISQESFEDNMVRLKILSYTQKNAFISSSLDEMKIDYEILEVSE